jgi:hypothetical protein
MISRLPTTFGQLAKRLTHSSENEKIVMLVTAVIIVVLVVDMELSNVADIIRRSIVSEEGVITFVIISMIYLSGQYLIVRFAKAKTIEVSSRKAELRFINLVVSIVQGIIISIFILVIIEISLLQYYGLAALIMVLTISNGLTIWVMLILSKRLYSYYKSNHERSILLYLVSGLIIAVTALVTICFMVPILGSKPDIITPLIPVAQPSITPGSTLDTLNFAYYILAIISFLSVWVATANLLYTYSKKLGKTKYWILVSLPLIFYVSQILIAAVRVPLPIGNLDPVSFIFYYRIIFTVSSTVGGILFAQPFIQISRIIPSSNRIHHQLIILGLGTALFFVSGSATVYHTPFPPFGLATVALTGFSAYLMFLGLYSSSVSLSEDSKLRKQIKRSAQDWKFFLKLSDAEVENRIIEQVKGVKDSMTTDTGIAPSISIEEAKDYLKEVLSEIKREQGN